MAKGKPKKNSLVATVTAKHTIGLFERYRRKLWQRSDQLDGWLQEMPWSHQASRLSEKGATKSFWSVAPDILDSNACLTRHTWPLCPQHDGRGSEHRAKQLTNLLRHALGRTGARLPYPLPSTRPSPQMMRITPLIGSHSSSSLAYRREEEEKLKMTVVPCSTHFPSGRPEALCISVASTPRQASRVDPVHRCS